jgi:hypothetical protein
LAGYLRPIDGQLKLKLIHLEEKSELLPSVLFVRHPNLSPVSISEDDYERNVADALRKDIARVERSKVDYEQRLHAYYVAQVPRTKKKPDPKDYIDSRAFSIAMSSYLEEKKALPVAIEYFEKTAYAEFKRNLERTLAAPLPEEQIRRRVRMTMMRHASQQRTRMLWETTFFNALLKDDMETLYGAEAIREYSLDSLGGFFLRSPKDFLRFHLTDRGERFL